MRILVPIFGEKLNELAHADATAECLLLANVESDLYARRHTVGEKLRSLRVFEPDLVTVVKRRAAQFNIGPLDLQRRSFRSVEKEGDVGIEGLDENLSSGGVQALQLAEHKGRLLAHKGFCDSRFSAERQKSPRHGEQGVKGYERDRKSVV